MMRNRIGTCFWLATAMIAASLAAPCPAAAQQVVAFVNGSPITTYDIDQRSKFVQLSTHKTPSRQEVLDALIDETIRSRKPSATAWMRPQPISTAPWPT